MMAKEDASGVPELILERYRLGELPAAEAKPLEQRLREDHVLRGRLQDLEASDRDLRRRYPPEWLAARIRSRLPQALERAGVKPAWSRRLALPAALASAAVLLMLTPRVFAPPPLQPGVRLKGLQPGLTLFRKTAEGSEPLGDGGLARAGDLIRVGYRAAGRSYGAIVSIDGRGTVTVHLPRQGEQAAVLSPAGEVLLDQAYELDDAPNGERFYFITSHTPFELAPLLKAARGAAAGGGGPLLDRLPLPSGLDQSTFSLAKGTTP